MSDPTDILNFRRISDRVTTSGQPTEDQLATLKSMGITQIINLGPHDNKGALPDETASVAALGMTYTYIPVDFDAPTEADYTAFCAALDASKPEKTHVHCIFNARVSAFFYRYEMNGTTPCPVAAARMESIWRPGGVWADFVAQPENRAQPNRYKGYEYD